MFARLVCAFLGFRAHEFGAKSQTPPGHFLLTEGCSIEYIYIVYILHSIYIYTIYYILYTIYIGGSPADLSISYRKKVPLKVYLRYSRLYYGFISCTVWLKRIANIYRGLVSTQTIQEKILSNFRSLKFSV